MVKMIRVGTNETVEYWEAWCDGVDLVIHQGDLGSKGTVKAQPAGDHPDNAIQLLSESMASKGYALVTDELLCEYIIQFRVDGFGTEDELNRRHTLEDALNETLGWTGNGHCDGGDTGSGTMNIWCYVLDPTIATETIKRLLRDQNALDGATLAFRRAEEYVVTYPIGDTLQM